MSSLPVDAAPPAAAPPVTAPLLVRTLRLTPQAGRALLAHLPARPPAEILSWVRRGEGLIGWGRAAGVTATGVDRFAALQQWWDACVASATVRDDVDVPGSGLVAFGSIAYAAHSPSLSSLVVPEVLLGCRAGVWWMTTVSAPTHPAEGGTVATLRGIPDREARTEPSAPTGVRFADGARSPADWAGVVGEAVERITAGELDKVVLARDLQVEASEPIDPRWVLERLAERYDTTWVFAVDGLLGATPELLVRREKGLVTSRVLAGTIRRTGDDAHDLALAASLARSSKDLEEHEYAVRSVAEALAPHCSSMNVPEVPFVLHLSNVMHLATDVAGVLHDATSSLVLAAALHPSAAVCGTPTAVADQVIAGLEGMDRGRYAGPVGWIDAAGDGEWGIALRCGELDGVDAARMRLFAGCGIVAGSDPGDEVAESDAKFLPMRDALAALAPPGRF